MSIFGVLSRGLPAINLKETEDGCLIPNSSVESLSQRHTEQIRRQVNLGRCAESLGFDYIAHSEHHSNLFATVCPDPILVHLAIARETNEIRLLQMANILPWHEPVRLAERLAMLDIFSDGRIDVGVGRGGDGPASETLSQYWGHSSGSRTHKQATFDEKFDILLESWIDDFVSYQGEFHSVPPTYSESTQNNELVQTYLDDDVCEYDSSNYLSSIAGKTTLTSLPVLPKPVQSPHPPLWKPVSGTHDSVWAARRGANICLYLSDYEHATSLIDKYYEAAEENGWPDRRPALSGDPFERGWDVNSQRGVAVLIQAFNTDVASEETLERWKQGLKYIMDLGTDETTDININREIQETAGILIGSTDELIDGIQHLRDKLRLKNPFILFDFDSIGIAHDEYASQLQSFGRDVCANID